MGELHNGDRPSGAQIGRHLESACAALPAGVEIMHVRADSGFYGWESGGELCEASLPIHHLSAPDAALGGGVEGGGQEAFAPHRCRRGVRISLSAGGMGPGLSLPGAAL